MKKVPEIFPKAFAEIIISPIVGQPIPFLFIYFGWFNYSASGSIRIDANPFRISIKIHWLPRAKPLDELTKRERFRSFFHLGFSDMDVLHERVAG